MTAPSVIIRDESSSDVTTIADLTVAAFAPLAISRHNEQLIVAALRSARALTVSLIAEMEGRRVGHIAFSPVVMSDGTAGWFGLGPVSFLPSHQRRGIGSALIRAGLSRGLRAAIADTPTRGGSDRCPSSFATCPTLLSCSSPGSSTQPARRSSRDRHLLPTSRGGLYQPARG